MNLPDYIKDASIMYILDESKEDGNLHVVLFSPSGTQLVEGECREAPLTEALFLPNLWSQLFRWFPKFDYSPSATPLKANICCNGNTLRCFTALLSGTWQEYEDSVRFDRELNEALGEAHE